MHDSLVQYDTYFPCFWYSTVVPFAWKLIKHFWKLIKHTYESSLNIFQKMRNSENVSHIALGTAWLLLLISKRKGERKISAEISFLGFAEKQYRVLGDNEKYPQQLLFVFLFIFLFQFFLLHASLSKVSHAKLKSNNI